MSTSKTGKNKTMPDAPSEAGPDQGSCSEYSTQAPDEFNSTLVTGSLTFDAKDQRHSLLYRFDDLILNANTDTAALRYLKDPLQAQRLSYDEPLSPFFSANNLNLLQSRRNVTISPAAIDSWDTSETQTPTARDVDGAGYYDARPIQPSSISKFENSTTYTSTHSCSAIHTPTASSTPTPLIETIWTSLSRPIFNSLAWPLHTNLNEDNMSSQWPIEQQRRLQGRTGTVNTKMDSLPPIDTDTSGLQALVASHSQSSDEFDTPPLTPDKAYYADVDSHVISGFMEDEDDIKYIQRHSCEIKQGKQPEHSVDYDTLMEDSPGQMNEIEHIDIELGESDTAAIADENDEWLGLEYAIELSVREQRMSESHESGGEHSKSRESWAMQRHGWVPPFLEEEDYYQWRNWHSYLDQVDDMRRHRKGYEFEARAGQLSKLYVEELYMRDMMYWQKDVYGATSKQLKDRLALLAHHRPDPYFPPQKHNLGWFLKRHQSLASLRELYRKEHPSYPLAVNSGENAAPMDL